MGRMSKENITETNERGEGQMEGITKMKNVGCDLRAGFRDGARRDVSSFSRAQTAVGRLQHSAG